MEPSQRVSRYLGRMETRRLRAQRTRILTLGVGVAVAAVAYLTSIGIAPAELRNVVASAGAVVIGVAFREA